MTRHSEPERLFQSEGEVPELRRALGAARAVGTSEHERARLGRALAPLLGVNVAGALFTASAPTAASVATAGISKLAVLWGAAATTLVGASVATAVLWSPAETALPADAQSTSAPVVESQPASSSVESAPVPSEQEEVVAQEAPPPAVQLAPGAAEPKPPAEEKQSIKPDPLANLERARGLLGSEPSRALALVGRHQKDFPRGPMVQERELIAIEALTQLGQVSAAKSRAERFKARYPGSIHLRHLDLLLKQ